MSMFPDESNLRAELGESPGGARPFAVSPPSSRLPLAGGILLALVAEAFLLLALALSGGSHVSVVELAVPMISGLFALGSCLLVSVALPGRERAAWTLMGLACVGVLVAQGTRFVSPATGANLSLASAGGAPSLASVALIAQSLSFFLAFLLFPPPVLHMSLVARLAQFFDGVLVVGAAMVAIIYFVLVPFAQTSNGSLTTAEVITLVICISDLLLLGGLTFALRSIGARQGPLYGALGILGVAMLLLVGADFAGMVLTPHQLAPANSPLQAIWNAGYLAIGLGALLRLRSESRKTEEGMDTDKEGSSIWLVLPFAVTVVVAGCIVVHAITRATTSTQMLVALVCASLLVALIGLRHLVGLLESRQVTEQHLAVEQHMALAEEQVDQFRSTQLALARARQQSLEHVLEGLTRFGYGDYQARVSVSEPELAPLADHLNALLDGMDRQLTDRDRGRETRLVRILTDALGRLALGEMHDLPELPSPGGSPLDGLMMSVVQVRTRLITLQTAVQQYEEERYEAQQQLEYARQELEQETQSQRQAAQEISQTLESQLHSERQVAQATEEQWQRERQRLLAQAQAAQTHVVEIEAMLHAAEQRLVNERLETQQRLMDERRALENSLREVPQTDPAQLARVREHSQQLVGQFTRQAERLHTAASTIQTAAEVAQRLARTIQETAALPEIQGAGARATSGSESGGIQFPQAPAAAGAGQTALLSASQPADPPSAPRQLSAMQMLERLAEGKTSDTAARMPAVVPAFVAEVSGPVLKATTGPLDEPTHERVARRLSMAASRAEEIANGLLELAVQCIDAGEESIRAAEEVGKLALDLEEPSVPVVIQRTMLPTRAPKSRR